MPLQKTPRMSFCYQGLYVLPSIPERILKYLLGITKKYKKPLFEVDAEKNEIILLS
jgi:hypothetical protein